MRALPAWPYPNPRQNLSSNSGFRRLKLQLQSRLEEKVFDSLISAQSTFDGCRSIKSVYVYMYVHAYVCVNTLNTLLICKSVCTCIYIYVCLRVLYMCIYLWYVGAICVYCIPTYLCDMCIRGTVCAYMHTDWAWRALTCKRAYVNL